MYNEKIGSSVVTIPIGKRFRCSDLGNKNFPYPSDWYIEVVEPLEVLEVTTKTGYLYPLLRCVIVLPIKNGIEFLQYLATEDTVNLFWVEADDLLSS